MKNTILIIDNQTNDVQAVLLVDGEVNNEDVEKCIKGSKQGEWQWSDVVEAVTMQFGATECSIDAFYV